MTVKYSAAATSLLPQYAASAAFMERFLVAAHTEGTPIARSPNGKGIKLVDGSELDADVLSYFTNNKDDFRSEFCEELKGRIGDEQLGIFCEVVARDWFDGMRLRREGRSRQLKRSVFDYLSMVASGTMTPSQFVKNQDPPMDVEPLITVEAVAAVLTVNDQMIYRHIEGWKRSHPNRDNLTSDDVFLRRGLALDRPLDSSNPYREWDFLNSYSIAFSAPEKFSQMMSGRTPAIVNGELSLFEGRVLFFSPFIPGMDVGQLEFGIIPRERPHPLLFQGIHAGIHEYILDPAPFQR